MGGGRKRSGGSSSYVVGHRYYAGLHLVLCHGPVDAITRIIVGERGLEQQHHETARRSTSMPATVWRRFAKGVYGATSRWFGGPAETCVRLSAAEARQHHSGVSRCAVADRPRSASCQP